MRFKFDHKKSAKLRRNPNRRIGFEEAERIFQQQYYLDTRLDNPKQFRAIGVVNERLYSLVFEIRQDEVGEYYHLITLWQATREEQMLYEENL